MSKVDILSTIIQFPGHIFAKIIVFSAWVAKSRCGEDKCFFYLFEKIKTLFKNPLRVFNIINIVYTIYVPSLINQKTSAKNWTFQSKNVFSATIHY